MRRYKRTRSYSAPPSPPHRRVRTAGPVEGPVIAYHGNYCGPNYSAGRMQGSVANSNVPAVDALDQLCKEHDAAYANGEDLRTADLNFAKSAWKHGLKGAVAAFAVGVQGLTRPKAQLKKRMKKKGSGVSHLFSVLKTGFMPRRKYKRGGRRKYSRKTKRTKKSNKKKTYRYRKRKRVSKYRWSVNKSNAATIQVEDGNNWSDPRHCIYIGHATATEKSCQALFMSMIKALFKAYGVNFADFQEKNFSNFGNSRYLIEFTYQFGAQDSPLRVISFPIVQTATYFDLAIGLLGAFKTEYSARVEEFNVSPAPVFNTLVLRRFEEDYDPEDPQANNYEVAHLDLNLIHVNFKFKSVLKLQNQTINGGGTGTTDVNNLNPLEGRVYYGQKNKNYFTMRYKYPGAETATPFWLPGQNGLILDRSLDHESTYWKELVKGNLVTAKRTKNFVLHPGQIVADTIYVKKKFHITLFLECVKDYFANLQDDAALFGIARVVGFDKMVFDRVSSQPTKVAYEFEQEYDISLTKYNRRAVPYTFVSDGPAPS